MTTRHLITHEDAQRWADLIVGLPRPVTVTWTDGKLRTKPQNNLMWIWNNEIAKHRGDVDMYEVHRENKYHIGCPILMRDSPKFASAMRLWSPMTYEEKIDAMEYLDITSIMSVPQMKEYMDAVYRKYTAKGVRLTDPEIRKWEGAA